jgi:hypothetical protein
MGLTTDQRASWSSDGYLVLKQVFKKSRLAKMRKALDALYTRSRRRTGSDKMDVRNILSEDPEFIDLIDPGEIFPIVLDLLGPYIQLSMAQALVRPPAPKDKGYVHADGGQAMTRIRVTETSLPLQLKIQYFLTDLRGQNRGNFIVYPGSHMRPLPGSGTRIDPQTPGGVQLEVEAGDAAIFPHALWHGVAPNRSKRARKTLIYCYSQMCFRQFDFPGTDPDTLDRCTPRQRRLLGDLGVDWRPGAYFYGPKDQTDVMGLKSP